MITSIKQSTNYTLDQLKQAIRSLDNAVYAAPMPILSNNTIGMHVRHILEFYQCLIFGIVKEENINYDKRLRNIIVETDSVFAVEIIEAVQFAINGLEDDTAICVIFSPGFSNDLLYTNSSISRELCYLMEHSIHHMAIIKMAYLQVLPELILPENFGVAFSTIKHNQEKHVHSNILATK
jgi:hypothetical protein